MFEQVVDACVYVLSGVVFGVAGTGWMLESDRRKARKQAIHDVEVSYRAISKLKAFARAEIARPGRGRTLPEIDLVRVAVKYSQLRGRHDVYGTLAEQCHISRNYTRNLVYEARKVGLLEPTTRGKPNFELTDKAIRFVENHLPEPEQED